MPSLLLKRSLYAAAASLTTGSVIYTILDQDRRRSSHQPAMLLPSYEATFSVPLTCDSCVQDVSTALKQLPGIQSSSFSVADKMVTIQGTEPPSRIITAIQDTGRAAILRGSGKANSAAVCILETPVNPEPLHLQASGSQSPVRGLARLIELGERLTMLDLTLTGMEKGRYQASLRQSGDISKGKVSMGGVFTRLEAARKAEFAVIEVDGRGRGSVVTEIGWPVWEMVGRGLLVERIDRVSDAGVPVTNGASDQGDALVLGVIARSAGAWENDKVVCGCSGKTVWEEREEMVSRGIS